MKFTFFVTLLLISLPGCWAALAGAGAEAGYVATQPDRSAGETVTDQWIVSRVKTELLADPDVSGLDINVDSFKSNVTLRGMVRSSREAEKAVRIARTVSGVRGVESKLAVEASVPSKYF